MGGRGRPRAPARPPALSGSCLQSCERPPVCCSDRSRSLREGRAGPPRRKGQRSHGTAGTAAGARPRPVAARGQCPRRACGKVQGEGRPPPRSPAGEAEPHGTPRRAAPPPLLLDVQRRHSLSILKPVGVDAESRAARRSGRRFPLSTPGAGTRRLTCARSRPCCCSAAARAHAWTDRIRTGPTHGWAGCTCSALLRLPL